MKWIAEQASEYAEWIVVTQHKIEEYCEQGWRLLAVIDNTVRIPESIRVPFHNGSYMDYTDITFTVPVMEPLFVLGKNEETVISALRETVEVYEGERARLAKDLEIANEHVKNLESRIESDVAVMSDLGIANEEKNSMIDRLEAELGDLRKQLGALKNEFGEQACRKVLGDANGEDT